MEQYISKSAVVAEIEKRIQKSLDAGGATRGVYLNERMNEDSYILSLVDNLEAEEVDLEYNGKAMLHVLEKGVEQGRRELIDKACEWLKKWDAYRVCLEGHKDWFIEQFRKAMKE